MGEFLASWVAAPDAVRTAKGDLQPGLRLGLALTALAFMTLPAAIGILVLLGSLT